MSDNPYSTERDDDLDGVDTIVKNANIFLDGESLILPDPSYLDEFPDEVSSINSSIHRGGDFVTFENAPSNAPRHLKNMGASPQTKSTSRSSVGEKSRTSRETRTSPTPNSPTEAASSSFVPLWIKRAPKWLKVVFLLSVLLLIGAMILVVVGLFLAMSDEDDRNASDNALNDGNGFTVPPILPSQTSAPVPETGVSTTPPGEVSSPTLQPTEAPVASPQTDTNLLVLYVTTGGFQVEPEQFGMIPTGPGNSFLVQLGNWNDANRCDDADYDEVKDLFSYSSVPVYFVVGNREYLDCSDPASAMDEWRDNLVDYETEFWDSPPYRVSRNEQNPELFAIEVGNTVVLSINAGQPTGDDDESDNEFDAALEENLNWIETFYQQNTENQRNFVLLSNQRLPGRDKGRGFFDALLSLIPTYDLVQFYLVQAGRDELRIQSEHRGILNLDVISVSSKAWPPLRISINATDDAEDPISLGYEYWEDNVA